MEINQLVLGDLQSNCYLLLTDKTAIVIDPGYNSETVLDFLLKNKNKERLILLTHGHFDHIGGALNLRNSTDTHIAIGINDAEFTTNPEINLSSQFATPLKPFDADIFLYDNQKLNVGDLEIQVIETPGHTPGGLCFLIDDYLFTGDTLFYRSIGRTDFPQGSFLHLKQSIKKLYTLNPDLIVFSGHGPKTNINDEKLYNPFVRG